MVKSSAVRQRQLTESLMRLVSRRLTACLRCFLSTSSARQMPSEARAGAGDRYRGRPAVGDAVKNFRCANIPNSFSRY